jgi:hypothetical protein
MKELRIISAGVLNQSWVETVLQKPPLSAKTMLEY